jgi:hypothetical protein
MAAAITARAAILPFDIDLSFLLWPLNGSFTCASPAYQHGKFAQNAAFPPFYWCRPVDLALDMALAFHAFGT